MFTLQLSKRSWILPICPSNFDHKTSQPAVQCTNIWIFEEHWRAFLFGTFVPVVSPFLENLPGPIISFFVYFLAQIPRKLFASLTMKPNLQIAVNDRLLVAFASSFSAPGSLPCHCRNSYSSPTQNPTALPNTNLSSTCTFVLQLTCDPDLVTTCTLLC